MIYWLIILSDCTVYKLAQSAYMAPQNIEYPHAERLPAARWLDCGNIGCISPSCTMALISDIASVYHLRSLHCLVVHYLLQKYWSSELLTSWIRVFTIFLVLNLIGVMPEWHRSLALLLTLLPMMTIVVIEIWPHVIIWRNPFGR